MENKIVQQRLLFLVFILFGYFANANTTFDCEGELDIVSKLGFKPSSEQGQMTFKIPSFKLSSNVLLDTYRQIYFQLQVKEVTNQDGKIQRTPELKQIYYEWRSQDDEWLFRYGLIKMAYLEQSENFYDLDVVEQFQSLLQRYNYLPSSDLGFELHYVPVEKIDFIFGFVNGEEGVKAEEGPQKDTYIGVAYDDSVLHSSLFIYRGNYDEFERQFQSKNREVLRVAYKNSFFSTGLEYFQAEESATGSTLYKRAEGWDGSRYVETMAKSFGASGWLSIHFHPEFEVFVRKDFVDPMQESSGNEINSNSIAIVLKDQLRTLILGYSLNQYGEFHSKMSNIEFGFLGLRQIF